MNLFDETQMILNQYGLRANKRLGQNFLINQEIIDQIVDSAEICRDDVVIEIGPGIGSLTKALSARAGRVFAIELDPNMVKILNDRFSFDNLTIIQDDVMKVDLKEIVSNASSVKVVANLPYYITSPIIMKLLEERLPFTSITVMVQKEVGERLCALPGCKSFGAITLTAQYFSNLQIALFVPKENFLPSPEVDSCVVKLDILKDPRVFLLDEKLFFELIRTSFNQRRKTISNSLASGRFSKELIFSVLQKLNIDSKLRAEDLSIEDFAKIANLIKEES